MINLRIIKRNKTIASFDSTKIKSAITKAFTSNIKHQDRQNSEILHDKISKITDDVISLIEKRYSSAGAVSIEDVQDQVELALMRCEEYSVAKGYVLYREKRSEQRKDDQNDNSDNQIKIKTDSGKFIDLNFSALLQKIEKVSEGIKHIETSKIFKEVKKNIFDGMEQNKIDEALIISTRIFVEDEHNYSFVVARLLLHKTTMDVVHSLGIDTNFFNLDLKTLYKDIFIKCIKFGVKNSHFNPKLDEVFDLEELSNALDATRDDKFSFLGMQTIVDRYLMHDNGVIFELPQTFFMRVAMGLALNEKEPNKRAIEFYKLLSSFDFMSSTPTLFNSGCIHSQLSSCYLTTVPDDLLGIYDSIKDNAILSKWAGGLGNDWTQVRGMGAKIKGTNGKSQGVTPFLKVVNDTAVAVNQGGKRKGAVCAYLELWHSDIQEFLELRKNTGDDRRRTHDMNTASWIPDLFMKRLLNEEDWTLFTPNEVPDLHDLYGEDFENRYRHYEEIAKKKEIYSETVKSVDLWKKMISMLFETGHPWITFKDPCNIRSPQQHVGCVHSSNLCTEITLNTSEDEIAVCNLGSVNLPNHIGENNSIDKDKLKKTISTAIRMLDNVIDLNYYAVDKAKNSNTKHRPIGLGMMGFHDALFMQNIQYNSQEAVEFADSSMELISYYAISSSSDLANEKGTYQSYKGSLWSQNIFPLDSLKMLEEYRGKDFIDVDTSSKLDWDSLKEKVKKQGMRNSNVLAIAPTATIANITNLSQSIEPVYQNLFVKSNLSGEFTVLNKYLVEDLRKIGLWDSSMAFDLRCNDGSVQNIDRVPDNLKELYRVAFEVDSKWIIEAASRRQKWIDQSQSLNLYASNTSGKMLDTMYKMAWIKGLKTTYYLRSMAATSVEKSTIQDGRLNKVAASSIGSPDEPECESCQ